MQNQEVYDELVAKFEKMYGAKPEIVAYAPGRIEVLGNHTDYNEGYVFSAAIDKGTFFAVSASADTSCELTAADLMETARFDVNDVKPAKERVATKASIHHGQPKAGQSARKTVAKKTVRMK